MLLILLSLNVLCQNIILNDGYRLTINADGNFTYRNATVGHYTVQWSPDNGKKNWACLNLTGYGGIGLGEMQIKRLQKIEELTLHVIEQNKKIDKIDIKKIKFRN